MLSLKLNCIEIMINNLHFSCTPNWLVEWSVKMSMNKKIIIKNYRQLTLDYVLLYSFLIINNILSYYAILPLSVSLLILILTLYFHHKLVKKDYADDASKIRFKYNLIICVIFILFLNTCWFVDVFIKFLINSIGS